MKKYSQTFFTLCFIMVISGSIILLNINRTDISSQLESRFINTTTVEKKELVEDFEQSELDDIQKSIEKYSTLLLPDIEREIRKLGENILASNDPELRDLYTQQLKRKLRERIVYKDALIGYRQLQTWYYEHEEGILGGNFEDREIISGENNVDI